MTHKTLADDEVFHVLTFATPSDLVKIYSLVCRQWLQQAMKVPIRVVIRSDDEIISTKQIESFQITELTWSGKRLFDTETLSRLELKHLTGVDLSCPSSGVDKKSLNLQDFKNFQFLRNLQKLKLNIWNLGSKLAECISHTSDLINLTELELSFTDIGDNGAFEILNNSNLTNLKSLMMKSSHINSISVTRMLENLTCLDLEGFRLTEFNGTHNIPNLLELNISKNTLLVPLFIKSFPKLTTLKMDSIFTMYEGFSDSLSHLKELKYLSLAKCALTLNTFECIGRSLSNLTYLDITENCTKFTTLFNSGTTKIRELILERNTLCQEDCKLIGSSSSLRNLTLLSFSYSGIAPISFEHILLGPNMVNLKTLRMNECSFYKERCKVIAQSTTLTNLTYLDIRNNMISDEGCQIICQTPNLQHLTHLDISSNNLTSIACIANNPYFSNLTFLSFDNQTTYQTETDPITDRDLIKTSPFLKMQVKSSLKKWKTWKTWTMQSYRSPSRPTF